MSRNPTQIHINMREIRSKNSNFVILARYSYCQASTLNLNRYDSIELLSSFNEQHFFTCFLNRFAWLQY